MGADITVVSRFGIFTLYATNSSSEGEDVEEIATLTISASVVLSPRFAIIIDPITAEVLDGQVYKILYVDKDPVPINLAFL